MYYESSSYHHDYLAHHGVKGMKWGVRRARNKQARQNYKAAKKKANVAYNKAEGQHHVRLSKANADYIYNGGSRQDMAIKKYNSQKQLNRDATKYSTDRAAAKRDYKIAKGKNADRANRKYDRAVYRAKSYQEQRDQVAINDLYKTSPKAAKYLASKGDIRISELNVARINAGIDAVETMNAGYNLYKRTKK